MSYLRPTLDTRGINAREGDIQAKTANRIEQTTQNLKSRNYLMQEAIENLPEQRQREAEQYERQKEADKWKLFQDQTKIVADMHAQVEKDKYPEMYDVIKESGLPHIQVMPTPEDVAAPGYDFEAYRKRATSTAADVSKANSEAEYQKAEEARKQKEWAAKEARKQKEAENKWARGEALHEQKLRQGREKFNAEQKRLAKEWKAGKNKEGKPDPRLKNIMDRVQSVKSEIRRLQSGVNVYLDDPQRKKAIKDAEMEIKRLETQYVKLGGDLADLAGEETLEERTKMDKIKSWRALQKAPIPASEAKGNMPLRKAH
jgi:hypothetical protein